MISLFYNLVWREFALIKINTDIHIHTMVSQHAYSTIAENVKYASETGLEAVAITDHGPGTKDGAEKYHFGCMKKFVPEYLYGVRVLKGIECSFTDSDATLDMTDEKIFKKLDLVIASSHESVYWPTKGDIYTQMVLKAMDNPYIDILGHIDRVPANTDYALIAKTAKGKGKGKVIELNEASFIRPPFEESADRVRKLMVECKKYGTKISVSSDSHFFVTVGKYEQSIKLLEEIDFDINNIVNRDLKSLTEFLNNRNGK